MMYLLLNCVNIQIPAGNVEVLSQEDSVVRVEFVQAQDQFEEVARPMIGGEVELGF